MNLACCQSTLPTYIKLPVKQNPASQFPAYTTELLACPGARLCICPC